MNGDNGEAKQDGAPRPVGGIQGEQPEAQQPASSEKCVLRVFIQDDGTFRMESSLLPPMVIYIFESLKMSLFAQGQKKESPIVKAMPGGILNFVRGGMRKK